MVQETDLKRLLCDHLHDPGSSFSIGSFGAIAEFHRKTGEPLVLDDPARLMIATSRGALRIDLDAGVTPLAYETLSGRRGRWQHGVVFCLPKKRAQSHRRTALTELGPDDGAVRDEDRDGILFDMGLGAGNVDFCIRTSDPSLLSILRDCAGGSVFDAGSPVMGAIIEASPHRVALSKLGRAEVYQAIGRTETPEGPHTHVLPKLLKNGRTHSSNIPVPRGSLPCLNLYPANPMVDSLGRAKPFDLEAHTHFQSLLARWGLPEHRAEKARFVAAVNRGDEPGAYPCADTRLGRTVLRVALRQAQQVDAANPTLAAWSRHFDSSTHQNAEPLSIT